MCSYQPRALLISFSIAATVVSRSSARKCLISFSHSLAHTTVSEEKIAAKRDNASLNALIEAYQVHGHRIASINPIDYLQCERENIPELQHARYGLSEHQQLSSLTGLIAFGGGEQIKTVTDLRRKLDETYCGSVSAEFSFIEDECEREWFAERFEQLLVQKSHITEEQQRELATELLQFQEFDRFMNAKLPSIKRYGGEGSESSLAFFKQLLESAANEDVDTVVLGMPHRGKLNCLATIFKQRPAKIFRKYRGLPEFTDEAKAMMDITNHFREFEMLFSAICFSHVYNFSRSLQTSPRTLSMQMANVCI